MSTRETKGPRLYTIPPDVSFLDTLAHSILTGDLPVAGGEPPDKLDLARWTVLLPTRRAVRALQDAFLRMSGNDALLLPRIRPLGDVDEDELELASPREAGEDAVLALSLPPAIGILDRRLALTTLVLRWSRIAAETAEGEGTRTRATPAQAASLAAQLAVLMDSLDTERVGLDALAALVPEQFAEHWQKTLDFLNIITEHWPRILEENGVMGPYARRDALMAAETERLLANEPDAPVIAAGSTGTVPATAALLEAVSKLGNGAVVFPGLDVALDEESWLAISEPEPHPEHPQFGMHQFLSRLGMTREEVIVLGAGDGKGGRARLTSEVMRPAGKTDRWLQFAKNADRDELASALGGLLRIDAPTEQDEAEVISLLLRDAVEQPDHTAALVTPDRRLARRVSARLEKWGLQVDDSAGKPLAKTLPGAFMDAVAEAAGSGMSPVPLLALLKHPLTRLGRRAGEMRRAVRLLELAAFRQPATAKGLAEHRDAVARARARDGKHIHPNIKRLGEEDWRTIDLLLNDLELAFEPLRELFLRHDDEVQFDAILRAHIEVGQSLASDETEVSAVLWRGQAGETLANFFEAMLAAKSNDLPIIPADYPDFYRAFISGLPVRERVPAHPRVFIWGPLEARLQRPDTVVLGGLNEGVWPATVESDPWLSRPMRAAVGLSAPERRIGLSAHDVAQLLGVEKVYLTRAEKADGTPTVASRWLLRLDAVLSALDLREAIKPMDPWLDWALARDMADPVPAAAPPAPAPPADARPKRLSVTRIESWIANPYSIFARDILRLYPLEALAGEPDAALRGMLVHDALMQFAFEYPDRLPPDIAGKLVSFADDLFAEYGDKVRISAFWRGQMAHFARWFATTEHQRRNHVTKVYAEVSGVLPLEGTAEFTLTARADRIDVQDNGELAIYDYKTGNPPTLTQVDKSYAPQLALEAAIARSGGFDGVPRGSASRLAYIRARGYGQGGEERDASNKLAPEALADEAIEHLRRLVSDYSKEGQPYTALRRPGFSYRFDDYAHLARVDEWQSGGGEE